MPILLTTPQKHPGEHGSADEEYAYAMITGFQIKPAAKTTVLTMEYGNVVDGAWSCGKAERHRFVLRDQPEQRGMAQNSEGAIVEGVIKPAVTDFTDLREALGSPADAEADADYYDALSGELYSWLIAQGYYQGTIV